MNLRDIEYVCAVAQLGHFGRAAEQCNVSQPTLSAQVRKLEEYLGVVLFERTNKSVRLTPVGQRVVEIGRTALRAAEEIEQTAEAHRDPTSGTLRLGIIPTVAPSLIPLFVAPLRQKFPSLALSLAEATTDRLLEQLEDGDLDAVIIATPPEGARLQTIPLYREPFWFAVPRGHQAAEAKRIDPGQIDSGELLLLADGHCLREQALDLCGRDPSSQRPDTSATSLETLVNLVAAGHGITLVPALSLGITTRTKGVATLRSKHSDAERLVRLVYRAGFPRAELLDQLARVVIDALPDTVAAVD